MSDLSLGGNTTAGQARFERRTYTTAEAAARLGVSRDVLQDNWHKLGGIRIGRTIRFPAARVDALVEPPPAVAEPSGAPETVGDPRVDALLAATRTVCREVAQLLKRLRRDADRDTKADLGEAQMALEDCLADLNALVGDRDA